MPAKRLYLKIIFIDTSFCEIRGFGKPINVFVRVHQTFDEQNFGLLPHPLKTHSSVLIHFVVVVVVVVTFLFGKKSSF